MDINNGLIDTEEVIYQESVSNINMKGTSVQDILGLENKRHQLLTQSISHGEIDIEMYEDLYNSSSVMQETVEEGTKELGVYDKLNKDMFLSLFKHKPEIVLESNMKHSTIINNRIMRRIVKTPEFKSLRANCALDLFNSALGTEVIGDKAVEIIYNWRLDSMEKLKDRKDDLIEKGIDPFDMIDDLADKEDTLDDLFQQQQSANDMLDELQGLGSGEGNINPHFQQAVDEINKRIEDCQADIDAMAKDVDGFLDSNDDLVENLTQKLTGAFSDADAEVSEVSDYLEAWGMSSEASKRIPFAEKKEAVERIRQSKKLKNLTKLIGRFKDTATSDQKSKTKNSGSSITSIKTGNEIERILPSEKLKLCNETTKGNFYRQYNQKELLQYQTSSNKRKNQGPIIVCCDVSGSMEGSREKWSKAISIAMLEIAHMQKRDYAAILFDYQAHPPIVIERDKTDPQKILDIAETFTGGGTSFMKPLNEALTLIKGSRFKKADIVFITDGESSIDNEFRARFNRIKADKEFKVMSICINTGGRKAVSKTLESFSDEVILLSSLADLNDANSDVAHRIFSGV